MYSLPEISGMELPIQLSFRYTKSDIAEAARAHYAARLRLWLDIPVIVVLIVGGGLAFWSPDWRWLGIACVLVAGTFLLVIACAFLIFPRILFQRGEGFRSDHSLTFSENGIHFQTAHIDSQLQWSLYSRAMITARSYILYRGPRSFTIVPKRVFVSEDQRGAFERLLALKIREIARKGS